MSERLIAGVGVGNNIVMTHIVQACRRHVCNKQTNDGVQGKGWGEGELRRVGVKE